MSQHINSSLALFKSNATNARFIPTVLMFHLQEKHLTGDRRETFDLNSNRPADFAWRSFLCCRCDLNLSNNFQITQPIFPDTGQNHIGCASANQRINPYAFGGVNKIVDF
ncbi:MAG: hypothetical protein ONB44_13555 [candidate division KSB1 bacterium]|nr:hypothetical protein [candidate division KSB1 bacterium]MDZ7303149.1 hypothetical protein [candidate division KSB1 bacterium]MDZ7310129.1 hypothetical protein [candidate division KSB1 bacterium]